MKLLSRASLLSLLTLAACQCGDDYAPLELRELMPADDVEFDVEWAPDTKLAAEDVVLRELEDLQPHDGVFRVPLGSPLLEGVDVGDIVVWPQVGVFEVLSLEERSGKTEVRTRWARFSDAVTRAHITFEHALVAGAPGRVVGVVPVEGDEALTSANTVSQPLTMEAGPVSYSEDGLTYQGETGQYGLDTELGISGDSISLMVSAGSDSVSASMSGQVRGISAKGLVFLDPEGDADPSVLIEFDDLNLDIDVELSVEGARGDAELQPRAALVFPFLLGPVPAYVSVGTRLGVRSSISANETSISTRAGFSMRGAVRLSRNDDGSFGAEGIINDFSSRSPSMQFTTAVTAGVGIDVDAPRLSFGLGRPGIATGSVYGTHSMEITANASLVPGGDYCARVSTGGAVLAGGEVEAFGWSISREHQLANRDGEGGAQGPACK